MAVLKSPRNNKNKGKWSLNYKISLVRPSFCLSAKAHPRTSHNAWRLLKRDRDNSTTVSAPTGATAPTVNSFKTHPLLLKRYLVRLKHRERLFTLLSFSKVVQN